MGFCIPKEFSDKFRSALAEGKVIPEKLAEMTSEQRRDFLKEYVGDDAKAVNALLESKLILKDQQRGLVTWAKKVAGISKETRNDLIAKIERMDKALTAESKEAFLEDLATQRLGTKVSFEEAQTVVRLAKEAEEVKGAVPEDSPIGSPERLAYGLKTVELQNYVRNLKTQDASFFKDFKADKLVGSAKITAEGLGIAKSLLSSMDNSFFGRQGIKVLYTNPTVWGKAFAKSWGDIRRELFKRKTDIEPMDLIKADIYSRPNAMNGKYERMKLDVGIAAEEAFPSSLPGKIPILGRLFNASETSFQGGALRMRADLADRITARAENFGVDTSIKSQAEPLGKLINSMTGRGGLGSFEAAGQTLNLTLFSPKFLTSNINTLTMHMGGGRFTKGPARRFAQREAAMNLAKIVGTTGMILFIADTLNPGSVEWDPRSSKFGKIKLGNTYFDITGGMAPIVTLASRTLVPTKRNGKWGLWSKSATTGNWVRLNDAKFGQQTALDTFENFFEGKASPPVGVLRDVWSGKNFQGEKPTLKNIGLGLITPLPIQSTMQRSDVEDLTSPEGLAGIILEGLGLSASTYEKKK